ncbi:hypothetical protein AVEN_5211-1 [Araneus ventricosus]|uniref:DUF4817 domain-containing protein n=1 Tax=Araneus ventricosus TaxID=182803 RepID=A0A4Y2G546_ARAVE|nr:hypothetical protein AVEN_5211-1 [Araneus ventricosus]
MLSDGVVLPRDNTHTARKTQELLQKFKCKSGATSIQARFAPNLGSKHLSGAKFSSNSDVKTTAQNWFNGQGRDFFQSWLNKFVLSDKCLNRFGDYVGK